jgi:CDP-diacylglycerol--serine O-phosphatidyltransferase
MELAPRFVGRLALADAVTAASAALGFVAAAVATVDVRLAAQLVLLAAVADGLDGVLARRFGGSPAGPYLDSLADVASFGVAPAMLVVGVTGAGAGIGTGAATDWTGRPGLVVLALGIPALFVAMAVVRLGLYTAYDTEDTRTVGVPTTLAATTLAAGILAGFDAPEVVLLATAVFCYLMVSPIRYPDLLARDALIMGVVHVLAALVPDYRGGMFPVALVTLALAYLVLGPRFYWGESERRRRG